MIQFWIGIEPPYKEILFLFKEQNIFVEEQVHSDGIIVIEVVCDFIRRWNKITIILSVFKLNYYIHAYIEKSVIKNSARWIK